MKMCKQGHTILNKRCCDCKTLQVEWYNYLSYEGFEDIESRPYKNSEAYYLKFKKDFSSQDCLEAKTSYFCWAREKLYSGNFKSDRDRMIWEYHTEGLSTRQISPRVGLEQSWIVRRIHRIENYLKTGLSSSLQMGTNCINSLSFSMGATT
jgi:hypothetical protein